MLAWLFSKLSGQNQQPVKNAAPKDLKKPEPSYRRAPVQPSYRNDPPTRRDDSGDLLNPLNFNSPFSPLNPFSLFNTVTAAAPENSAAPTPEVPAYTPPADTGVCQATPSYDPSPTYSAPDISSTPSYDPGPSISCDPSPTF